MNNNKYRKCAYELCDKSCYWLGGNSYSSIYCPAHHMQKRRTGTMKPIRKIISKVCTEESCNTVARYASIGLCAYHDQIKRHWFEKVTSDQNGCEESGCEFKHYAKGKCYIHYKQNYEMSRALNLMAKYGKL